MPLIDLSAIEIGDRQRTKIERTKIQNRKDSIAAVGLLTPIVVNRLGNGRYYLIAGHCRMTAVKELHDEKRPVRYSVGPPIESGKIPATVFDRTSIAELMQMEFDENEEREKLEWQDRIHALATIVAQRKKENPQETQVSLARETYEKLGGDESSPRSVSALKAEITQAVTLATVLQSRPDLRAATSADAAYRILLKEQHEKFESELVRRKLLRAEAGTVLWTLDHGDAQKLLPQRPEGEVDLILVDPPYGIDADKNPWSASQFHRYEDNEQYARDLSIFIIQEGWRLTKPKANLFMFCSWKSFDILRQACSQYGWQPWFHPLIWQKGEGTGHSPWGSLGVRHDYEIFLWATKGQRGIAGPISDVFDKPAFQKVASRAKIHGAEKPVELLKYLIEISTRPYDLVLDPCAGSGSSLVAAVSAKRRIAGIEIDETYYNRALTRMQGNAEKETQLDLDSVPA